MPSWTDSASMWSFDVVLTSSRSTSSAPPVSATLSTLDATVSLSDTRYSDAIIFSPRAE